MKLAIKHRLLVLTLVPTLLSSGLWSIYLLNTHLQNFTELFIPLSMIVLLTLSLAVLYAQDLRRHLKRPLLSPTMAKALDARHHQELQKKIDAATLSLRRSLETLELENLSLEINCRTIEPVYAPPSSQTLDWQMSIHLAGGQANLAREFLTKLIIALPLDKQLINADFLHQDWTKLGEHVHRLHGACSYCGVPQLKYCAQNLESGIASQSTKILNARLQALNLAIDAVLLEAQLLLQNPIENSLALAALN